MTPTYKLKQLIFLLYDEGKSIIPGIISNIIINEKITGTEIIYMATFGPKNKEKTLNIHKIKGEVFSNLDELKETLNQRMSNYLNELITETKEKIAEWYKLDSQATSTLTENNNILEQQNPLAQEPNLNPEEARQKLRNLLLDEVDDTIITLEDGRKIKVNNNAV